MLLPDYLILAFAVWGLVSLGAQIVLVYLKVIAKQPTSEWQLKSQMQQERIQELKEMLTNEQLKLAQFENEVVRKLMQR